MFLKAARLKRSEVTLKSDSQIKDLERVFTDHAEGAGMQKRLLGKF